MYNILLTDDEQIVIDSISFIINNNFEGQVKIFTALSGTQALEIVTRNDIDIIFMDINMPGINGLETVSCITKLKPETVIIMLSAFDNFQYAQEAINIGAFKYLTKPFNKNTIIQTIRTAMDVVDSKRGNKNIESELNKKLDLVSPILESDFIYSCVFNNNKSDISKYFEYFNISDCSFYFCCIELANISVENNNNVQTKIREIFNKSHKCFLSFVNSNKVIALFTTPSPRKLEEIKEEIKTINTELSITVSSGIKIGVSSIQNNKELFSATYNEAIFAQNNATPDNKIVFYSDIPESTTKTQNLHEFKNQLITRIQQGDKIGLQTFFELYISNLFETTKDLNSIKNVLFELCITAKNITQNITQEFSTNNFDNLFSFLISQDNLSVIKSHTNDMLLECVTVIASKKQKIENPIISKICSYINQNLSSDISLEQMAEYTNVSSFYLSKLFKEEKGVTFINFITDKRLEEAQKLLKETNLSIKEITAKIGYNDQNYFSRIFKNKYGITPSEARTKL